MDYIVIRQYIRKIQHFQLGPLLFVVFIFLLGVVAWLICGAVEWNCNNDLCNKTGNSMVIYLFNERITWLIIALYCNIKTITILIAIIAMNDIDIKIMLIFFCICFGISIFLSLPCAFFYFVSCTSTATR